MRPTVKSILRRSSHRGKLEYAHKISPGDWAKRIHFGSVKSVRTHDGEFFYEFVSVRHPQYDVVEKGNGETQEDPKGGGGDIRIF